LIYSRINNPDLEMLEDRLAIWDQAEASLVFASGMAAISTALWAYAHPGTVIVHSGPVYGGTDFLLKKILPQFGVTAIGFLSEGGNRAIEKPSRRRAAKGPLRRFISKRQQIPQTGWWISSVPGRSSPASTVRAASGRLSSLTIRCWDRFIRPLWHMVLIWSSRRLLNMSAVIPT
jgi:methionine-gamma-lyase